MAARIAPGRGRANAPAGSRRYSHSFLHALNSPTLTLTLTLALSIALALALTLRAVGEPMHQLGAGGTGGTALALALTLARTLALTLALTLTLTLTLT